MGQKSVKFRNETCRTVSPSIWALLERDRKEVFPYQETTLTGDSCVYTVSVLDEGKTISLHGVYFPNIDWIVYYQDQKEICHILTGKGGIPLDFENILQFYTFSGEDQQI